MNFHLPLLVKCIVNLPWGEGNKYMFNKRKKKENETEHPMLKMKKILSDKTCHDVGAKTCCSWNCYQQVFLCEMIILLRQEFCVDI
jgi:hypothetical protein